MGRSSLRPAADRIRSSVCFLMLRAAAFCAAPLAVLSGPAVTADDDRYVKPRADMVRTIAAYAQHSEKFFNFINASFSEPSQNLSGVQCINCHQPIQNKKHQFSKLTLNSCKRCHDGEKAESVNQAKFENISCKYH